MMWLVPLWEGEHSHELLQLPLVLITPGVSIASGDTGTAVMEERLLKVTTSFHENSFKNTTFSSNRINECGRKDFCLGDLSTKSPCPNYFEFWRPGGQIFRIQLSETEMRWQKMSD